jgi:hypothetical protein
MKSASTGTSRFSVSSSKPSDVADDRHVIFCHSTSSVHFRPSTDAKLREKLHTVVIFVSAS